MAADRNFHQYLWGSEQLSQQALSSDKVSPSYFLFSWDKDIAQKDSSQWDGPPSPFLSSNIQEEIEQGGSSAPLLGDFWSSEHYQEYENRKILGEARGISKDRVSFLFMNDNFDYQSTSGVFNRIYRDSKEKDFSGILLISQDWYFSQGFLSTLYGFGIGVGYSGGKGIFVGSGLDDDAAYTDRVRFKFYTAPLDLRLGIEFSLGPYLALGAFGGPSALAIVEYRSDQEGKVQFGTGYFTNAHLKFFLGHIITKLGMKLYDRDSVNRFSMNLEMRSHSYSQFKDRDIKISGSSFGLGFSYDFL